MTTNPIPALVSSCGGKAKPQHSYRMPTKPPITGNLQIDHDNEDAYNDGVEWYNRIVAEFDKAYPELYLTTPMPPYSTIMIEPEPVWQTKPKAIKTWFTLSTESVDEYKSEFPNQDYRHAYHPIKADQQSNGEKEKPEANFRHVIGEWQVVDDYEKYVPYTPEAPQIYIWDGDEQAHKPICDMGDIGDMNYAQELFNATLISKAPRMLNILQYLLDNDDGVGICLGYQSREMIEDVLKCVLSK